MSRAHARLNLALLGLYLALAFASLSVSVKTQYLSAGLFGDARFFAGYFPNLIPALPVQWGIGAVVAAGFLYALLLPVQHLRAIVPFLLAYILLALIDVGGLPPRVGLGALVLLLCLIGIDGILGEIRPAPRFSVTWPARAWPLMIVLLVIAIIRRDPALFVAAVIPFRPTWIPARRPQGDTPVVFFDGECGLCLRSVDFLLTEDLREILKFAPLRSRAAQKYGVSEPTIDVGETMILADNGRLYEKSDAVLRCADYLGGGWRLLARMAAAVPRDLRDRGYMLISRRRHRFFPRGEECRIPGPGERARFLS